MSLSHVSDQDIVECLQNCPELDGPLFDGNILDELCFSDELWANLELPERQSDAQVSECTGLQQVVKGSHQGASQMVREEVPGIVTPPYSPPTPQSSTSESSLGNQPSSTPGTLTPSSGTPSQPPNPATGPAVTQSHLPLCTVTIQSSPAVSSTTSPQQPSTNTQKPSTAQTLSSTYPHMTLPHFNGSLQVLKSGEAVYIPQLHGDKSLQSQPKKTPNQSTPVSKGSVKQEPVVVGQKRQHPDTGTSLSQVDMSTLSKKQQRMIKNRESASISRQKKRQYVDSLEARLREAALKNSTLLQENTSLRKQVTVLEKENENLRLSLSRPSSPSSSLGLSSPMRKPTLVLMLVLCFSLTAVYWNRNLIPLSNPSRSPTTALTHIKSRALLSIETEDPPHDHEDRHRLSANSKALVPLSAKRTAMNSELEERIRKWKSRSGSNKELPAQQVPTNSGCSCPIENSTKHNLTSIKLIHEEMTNCFKLSSHHGSNDARKNSLAVLNYVYPTDHPNYLMDGPERLYQDFRKFVPQDLDNYYLLSFKEHVLLHPSRQNSSNFPYLSVFIPADSDFTSLLQMDCEVTATKVISYI